MGGIGTIARRCARLRRCAPGRARMGGFDGGGGAAAVVRAAGPEYVAGRDAGECRSDAAGRAGAGRRDDASVVGA
ncbi:hypothetical protein, partial [Burkholderia pseudomallei]|uniref:hypothetical protein n=1 Tax=Burkholderia pseudomallei TaxID=28450 RepID=UPI0022875C96